MFRTILATTREGVWVIDAQARTVLVNPAMATMIGETVEGMLGRTMYEFMDPDLRPLAEANFVRRQLGLAERHEFALLRGDGTVLETMMATNPLYDEAGAFRGALAIVSDISAKKRQERTLELLAVATAGSGAEFFESLVVNLASVLGTDIAVIGVLSPDGERIELVAAADRGRLVEPFDYPLRGGPCEQVLAGKVSAFPAEVRAAFPDDPMLERLGVESYVGTPLLANGSRLGVLVVMHRAPLTEDLVFDLEALMRLCANRVSAELERKQVEDALRKSEAQLVQSQRMEAVGRLAGGIAHDFNNLLMAILGNVDLALDPSHELIDPRAALVEVRAAALRAADLTRQLLAFSRKQVIATRDVDVHAVIYDTTRMLRRMLGEDIRIAVDLAEGSALVRGDAGQLQRVLLNLALNARDAMPTGGTLRFATRVGPLGSGLPAGVEGFATGDYVHVLIEDTGTGMDEDTLAHAFEPFFTTKDMGEGTGLGLASSHGIITQLGGWIWADSELERGTTVHFVLPRIEREGATVSERQAPTTPAIASATILVVEDEPAVRAVLSRALVAAGYEVITASEGRDALERVAAHRGRIDLVLCDIVMPGMRGGEVVMALLERHPNAAVIFMSGYPDVLQRSPGVPANAEIVTKPFTLPQIVERVTAVLEQRRAAPA